MLFKRASLLWQAGFLGRDLTLTNWAAARIVNGTSQSFRRKKPKCTKFLRLPWVRI